MQKGFILPIIFLSIIVWGGYTAFNHWGKYPNSTTQQTAASIQAYPNSKSWEITNRKNVCLIPKKVCTQPSVIKFNSEDAWNNIYFYYKEAMIKKDWSTKSTIVTSIPTDITFTKINQCTAVFQQQQPFFPFQKKTDINTFSATITCPAT
ncbi:MAG: hypothetical protein Q8P25_03955 [Candidatus Curtissbacteria bacterium]|nr:hypothetical protein [Candidatus Curtissbacteria bacterium]